MYRPLETPKSIRLIGVLPGIENDVLKCSIKHHDLNTHPIYEAISYVWGDAIFSARIICDDRVVRITPSLYQALRRVRLEDAVRTVWADSLSINQEDDVEKSQQVQLMQHIYHGAQRVLVWLGPDTYEVAKDAFTICRMIAHRLSEGGDLEDLLKNELRVQPDGPQWSSFTRLVECAWWTRVWIVQEFVLARRTIMFWGREEISWSHIHRAIRALRDMDTSMPQAVFPPSLFDPISRLFALKWPRDRGGSDTLLAAMRLTRPLRCSNDRDRIYGLLGLHYSQYPNREDTALVESIVPDYTKSVTQVYWEFAVRAFKFGVVKDMLGAIQHGPALEEWYEGSIPSWVPRWDLHYIHDFPDLADYEEWTCTEFELLQRGNDHDPWMGPRVVGPNNSMLLLPGARIEHLTAVSANLHYGDSDLDLDVAVDFWARHLHPHIAADVGQNLNADFCEALTFYFDSDHHIGILVAHLEHIRVLRSRSEEQHNADTMLESLRLALAEAEKEHGHLDNPVHMLWMFRTATSYALRNTRLFLTDNGRIGLCSITARVGDCVALFHKAGCPMLLRPQGTFYQLVGGSYVPSLTTKEALTQASQKSVVETLDIR